MLKIFYGRENLDKEKFIFERVGKRALIMVPDQYTLEAEKQAFRHLGIASLMDIEVVSAASLGSNILNELGGNKRNFINKYGRHMLLYKSAETQKENLQVFRGLEKKSSFIDSVNNFISEMKQYDCSPSDLKAMADSCEADSYTQKKLNDIYNLFADYEKQIEGKYTDSEDRIDLYLEKIGQSELIKDNEIWVYGFDSFAPKTLALLGQLMVYSANVNLVLTYDDKGRDRDLFELTGIVMANAERLADSLGVEHSRQPIPKTYVLGEKAKAISHIEKELYTMPSAKSFHHEGVTLVEAASLYNEAESAAAYVLHLVRDKGLRYKDIRLICNDLESRGSVIERAFGEYGIDVFSDAKRDILSNPIIKFVISLIGVVIEKYNTTALLDMLKSGFGDLNGEEIADLENYAIKYKIRGTMWKKPFRRGKSEYGDDGLAGLELLRQKAIEPIVPLEEIFKEKTTAEFLKSFYGYLSGELNLPEKILNFIAQQEEKELFDHADETARIWKSLSDVLNQIYEIMGDEPFDAESFRDILVTGLGQVEIGLLPPTEDGLILGNVQRSRSGKVKAIVVIGANEGILPQEKPTEGLLSAEEREMFKEQGREVCKVDSIRFMEERLAVYRNLSTPAEYLWVGCSLTDGEGNSIKPSRIFLKLKEMFPEIEVSKDALNSETDVMLINSRVGGKRHITEKLQEVGEGKPMDLQWGQAVNWLEKNRPDEMNEIRRSISFTNKQEDLGKAASTALFKKDTAEALSLSPSRIERFSRCPFSHLVTYGLKPEERRIFEAAPREIGDIYHQCLMAMTKELTTPGVEVTADESKWLTVTREECRSLVEREIEEIAQDYKEGLFLSGNLESYRRKRVTDICSQVCWTVVEQVRAGRIKAISPEIGFGRHGELPPIEIDANGDKVYIEGVIDRVDYLSDDRVKIIDYKTGNENFSIDEATAGYRLQLMLYLDAACGKERKPAGVFYFRIQEPMVYFSNNEIDAETLEKEIRKSFKLDGVMVDDPVVVEDIAGKFGGYSEIAPVRMTKEGLKDSSTGKKEHLLSAIEFQELQEAVAEKIKEACTDLLKGKIDPHPMKTKDRSACTYCNYKGICRFDTVFDGCSYNII